MVRLVELLRSEGELGEPGEPGYDSSVARAAREVQSLEKYLLEECKRGSKTAAAADGGAHHDAETLAELERRVTSVLCRKVEIQDGLALFNKLQTSVLLPTGISTLDALLGGGLREGQVTELFGASPSGKTQVCHCVSACAAWLGYPVVYLTSNASFSPNRLVKLSKHVLHHFNLTDSEGTLFFFYALSLRCRSSG